MSNVNKTSQATRLQIRDKTSYALPNNPSKALMQPNQIKNYLGYLALLDQSNSIMSELDRIVDEINGILGNDNTRIVSLIEDVGDKTNLTTTQKTNLVNAINELVTAIGTIRTSVNNANTRVDDLYRFLADNGLDNDTIISNVNEILAFITTLPETKTLVEYLDEKADKTSLNELHARLEAIADSDDTTLDQFTELINFIRTKAGATELANGLAGKVDKVDGKGLSTNDYDDTEKAKVLANTNARHSHANKGTLDQIQVALTTAMKNGFDTTDQKNLYHLGAYDSVSSANGIATITRQTGYMSIHNFVVVDYLTNYTNINYIRIDKPKNAYDYGAYSNNLITNKYLTYNDSNWDSTECIGKITGYADVNCYWIGFTKSTTEEQARAEIQDLIIQYKLATSYTEQVIENQPINTLDVKQSQILKDDIDNGLNVCNTFSTNSAYGQTATASGSIVTLNGTSTKSSDNYLPYNPFDNAEVGKTYTLSMENLSCEFDAWVSGTRYIIDTTHQTLTLTLTQELKEGSWRFVALQNSSYNNVKIKVMLVEGSHAYPYVPYNANKHITNGQAELLKDEFDRCSNLLPSEYIDYGSTETALSQNVYLSKGTYTISYSNITLSSGQWQVKLNGVLYGTYSLTQTSITFDVSSDNTELYIYCNQPMPNAKFMLNTGTEPLPYQDYEGKIVHEKDLNSLIARIVALENR